jgi:cytochrome b
MDRGSRAGDRQESTMERKLIWDLPTRLFHWSLVALIGVSWYSVEVSGDMDTHMLVGQIILVLILFRLIWGFIGTRYARFSSFAYGPATIVAYARSLAGSGGKGYAGHNPLGGLVVFLMLALILAQTTSGLFATDGDFYSGPLNDLISGRTGNQVTEFHEVNFNLLLGLVVLHIAAVVFYRVVKGQNLIAAMITGFKQDNDGSLEPIAGSRLAVAVAVLVVAAAIVFAVVTLL